MKFDPYDAVMNRNYAVRITNLQESDFYYHLLIPYGRI